MRLAKLLLLETTNTVDGLVDAASLETGLLGGGTIMPVSYAVW
jgi:hypothetical protein